MAITLQELVVPLKIDKKAFQDDIKAAGVAIAAGVGAVVAGMGLAVKATFDWANEIDSLGDVMDGTNDQMAALAFTARKSGVGVDKVAKANVIFQKGLLKTNGTLDTIGLSLKKYGIDVKTANGQVKDSVQLTDEISKKFKELGTQQEKVNFLTEIYGKSGAEMVDFFDTLNGDGGISAVTDKVKKLGLAIDPSRYEQFNRSLEELKLIGTGLAVRFTEKVMPVLEKFLDIILGDGTISEKLATLVSEADTFVGNAISAIATAVDNWVASGGPAELSKKIVAWFGDIGTGEGFNSKIVSASENLFNALKKAIEKIDWEKISDAMDEALAKSIVKVDWNKAGISFKESLIKAFTTPAKQAGDDTFNVFSSHLIDNFLKTDTGQAMSRAVSDWFAGVFSSFEKAGRDFAATLAKWDASLADWVQTTLYRFYNWGVNSYNTVVTWVNKIITALNKIPAVNIGLLSTATPFAKNPQTKNKGRATGGPVVAGQAYGVAEFNKSEVFTPNTSGRVDPKRENVVNVDFDYSKLARLLAQEVVKARA